MDTDTSVNPKQITNKYRAESIAAEHTVRRYAHWKGMTIAQVAAEFVELRDVPLINADPYIEYIYYLCDQVAQRLAAAEVVAQCQPEFRLTFKQWLKAIDEILWDELGLTKDDLPDAPLRDWYDEYQSPIAAVRQLLGEVIA